MACGPATRATLINAGLTVLQDLLSAAETLLADAADARISRSLTPDDDPTESDINQLVSDLQQATEGEFLIKFAYTYNGVRSRPLDLVPGGHVSATEDFVIVADGDRTAMTNYVDSTVLGPGNGLPSWFTDNFSADILDTMSTILGQGLPAFQYEVFQQQYNDPSGQQKPISVNSIMSYASVQITVQGQTASKSVIYFAGVYYNSGGWDLVPRPLASNRLAKPDDPPRYPIIQIAVATGTLAVSAALVAYILRLPPPPIPRVGITIGYGALSITFNVFKWPWELASSDPDYSAKRSAYISQGIDSAWIEDALKKVGYSFTVKEAVSDEETTKEIVLILGYNQKAGGK